MNKGDEEVIIIIHSLRGERLLGLHYNETINTMTIDPEGLDTTELNLHI